MYTQQYTHLQLYWRTEFITVIVGETAFVKVYYFHVPAGPLRHKFHTYSKNDLNKFHIIPEGHYNKFNTIPGGQLYKVRKMPTQSFKFISEKLN